MKKVLKKENIKLLSLLLFICFILFWLNYTGFFEELAMILDKLSFRLFNSTSEFASCFPSVFLTLLPIGFLFSFLEKIKNEKFAKVFCIIALIPLEYVVINELTTPDGIRLNFFLSVLFLFLISIFTKKTNLKLI